MSEIQAQVQAELNETEARRKRELELEAEQEQLAHREVEAIRKIAEAEVRLREETEARERREAKVKAAAELARQEAEVQERLQKVAQAEERLLRQEAQEKEQKEAEEKAVAEANAAAATEAEAEAKAEAAERLRQEALVEISDDSGDENAEDDKVIAAVHTSPTKLVRRGSNAAAGTASAGTTASGPELTKSATTDVPTPLAASSTQGVQQEAPVAAHIVDGFIPLPTLFPATITTSAKPLPTPRTLPPGSDISTALPVSPAAFESQWHTSAVTRAVRIPLPPLEAQDLQNTQTTVRSRSEWSTEEFVSIWGGDWSGVVNPHLSAVQQMAVGEGTEEGGWFWKKSFLCAELEVEVLGLSSTEPGLILCETKYLWRHTEPLQHSSNAIPNETAAVPVPVPVEEVLLVTCKAVQMGEDQHSDAGTVRAVERADAMLRWMHFRCVEVEKKRRVVGTNIEHAVTEAQVQQSVPLSVPMLALPQQQRQQLKERPIASANPALNPKTHAVGTIGREAEVASEIASDTTIVDETGSGAGASPVPLPVGWEELWDAESGYPYYYQESTGQSVWERPAAIPTSEPMTMGEAAVVVQCLARLARAKKRRGQMVLVRYEKVWDENSQAYYYHHTKSGTTSWVPPRGVPEHKILTHEQQEQIKQRIAASKVQGKTQQQQAKQQPNQHANQAQQSWPNSTTASQQSQQQAHHHQQGAGGYY